LRDLQRFTRDFDVVAGMASQELAVGAGESAADTKVTVVTANFWRLFEMRPALGRFFAADEDSLPETSHVAVLGYGYWLNRFGGSASVLGQALRIGRNVYTIIGVAPRGFTGASVAAPNIVIPMTALLTGELPPMFADLARYNFNTMTLIARRRAGVTLEHATSDLSAAFRRSYDQQVVQQPWTMPAAIARPRVVAAPVQVARGPDRSSQVNVAIWLVGVAAIVLLIACANVGNLLLARAFGRRREIAVRLALGVGRWRLVSQLLTESVVLALFGGVAGMIIARAGGGVLQLTLLPSGAEAGTLTDTRVLLMCAVVALLVGVVTGLAPALYAGRSDVAAALKSGAREGALHRSPLRAAMLVAQGALSVVLLVGSGLFVQSLRHAQAVPMGFDADRVLWVETELRGVDLPDEPYRELQLRLLERARSLPGVERGARMLTVPFGPNSGRSLFVEGIDSVSRLGRFELQAVSAEYFATMGTRLLRGRGIEVQDGQGAPQAMVVSQSMARKLWPGREAIGQCVRVGADTMPCTTVVGIAADIKTADLSDDAGLLFYTSIDQLGPFPFWRPGLFVRARGEAAAAANTVRRALQELMPGAAYVKVTPLADQIAPRRRAWEVGAKMFTVFGALALLVASVGLYSVVSYGVAQRSQELAVRVALGAQLRDIVRMVVGEGVRTMLVGTAIGLAVAYAAGRWVGPLLFQTSPRDPVVFGGVAALLVGIALVASAIPAVRAARVDPVTALRAD
jgi:predicted permease